MLNIKMMDICFIILTFTLYDYEFECYDEVIHLILYLSCVYYGFCISYILFNFICIIMLYIFIYFLTVFYY